MAAQFYFTSSAYQMRKDPLPMLNTRVCIPFDVLITFSATAPSVVFFKGNDLPRHGFLSQAALVFKICRDDGAMERMSCSQVILIGHKNLL